MVVSEAPRIVEAGGLRFACLCSGDSGPLVLMLHGFPDTAHTWDATRPALAAAGFRVVAPFMRGYAPTEIPADERYDADTLGGDVIALVEALGEQKAVVVGHDWGASAAFAAVGLAPERIAKLVTMAVPHPAGVLPTPRMLWAIRHFIPLRRRGAEAMVRANEFAYVDTLLRRWSPAWTVPPGESHAVKRAFAEPGCLRAALGYYRALSPFLPASQRRKVDVPAVAFAGETDVVPPSAYERARSRYADDYEIVRLPGGHFMHREHPDRFTKQLLRVLAPLRP
jgi:pimeloyl-ACP methyl ester carboxylesterase